MKFPGFIGPAYTLDSVNVDAQRCVNLYPEAIESGTGKEANVAYLKSTHGLNKIIEVGDGPIRLIHVDSIGRIFVVSGNQLFTISQDTTWRVVPVPYTEIDDVDQSTDVDTSNDEIDSTDHGYYTGLKVQVSSSNTLPTGLSASTDYWVINIDSDSFRLATSLANALAGTDIDITGAGTGTMTVTPQIPSTLPVPQDDIDADTDTIAVDDHGFYTGLRVMIPTVGETSGGIDPGAEYYIIRTDDDNFQIANSIANASAGTEVTFTAVSGDWTKTLIGSRGEDGGNSLTLLTSSGPIKAASMSALGDGDDSSTIFVDGSSNYLFYEEASSSSTQLMASLSVVEAIFTTDLTIYTEQTGTWSGKTCNIFVETRSFHRIVFDDIGSGDFLIRVQTPNDATAITTAELAEFINNGSISGKTVTLVDTLDPALGTISDFRAFGGDDTSVHTALAPTSDDVFEANTYTGSGYGSVQTANDITWIDGYFIVTEGGTNKFYVSDLAGFNIDTLSFASAEGSPDILLAVANNHRDLWLFGEKTIEIFVNTGNADFPFERVQGGFIEVGLLATSSVAKIAGTLLWLGRNNEGQGSVYMANGMRPQRVSTHAIEQAIAGYANPSTASAFAYHWKGHNFYVLNFAEATWVYDLSTGLWHERAYTNEGTLERHRVGSHGFSSSLGLHIVGDYETGEVYIFDDDTYSDDGDAITRLRASPHVSNDLKRLHCSKFQLDMETGIGLDGDVQGSEPTVMHDFSDDGGHTWSSESFALADAGSGEIGEYKTRVIWRRLGTFRDRIFRVKITDPVKIVLIGAHIDLHERAS